MPQYPPAPGFGAYYPPKPEVWRQLLGSTMESCLRPLFASLHLIVCRTDGTASFK
jgi:hypothetical protein